MNNKKNNLEEKKEVITKQKTDSEINWEKKRYELEKEKWDKVKTIFSTITQSIKYILIGIIGTNLIGGLVFIIWTNIN